MEKMRLELFERKKKKKEQQGGGYPGNHGNQMDELEQAELFNNCCTVGKCVGEKNISLPCLYDKKVERCFSNLVRAQCRQRHE